MHELVPLWRAKIDPLIPQKAYSRCMARPEFSFVLNAQTSRWEVMYWPLGGTEVVVRDYPTRTEAAEHVAYANSPRRPSS